MSCSTLAISGNSFFPPNFESKNSPERKAFVSLLKKCKHASQIQSLHARIIRKGRHHDPFIVFELIRVCSNFNYVDYASRIFQHSQNPNVYLYTALIDAFVLSCSYGHAIGLYCQMMYESILPDAYALTSVLKACGSWLALAEGKQVHGQVLKLGLSLNRSVRMKLIEFYGKCGEFKDARQVFVEMPEEGDVVASTVMITSYVNHGRVEEAISVFNRICFRDTVCWTAMIDGLVRNGEFNRALELFREMQREDVKPNEVTIVCVLSACSQLGALELGRWVHLYMEKYEIELNHIVGGALISMYSRCGDIDEAQRVFDGMKTRDVITYNSMISGLAMHGKSMDAIKMFQQMKKQGITPNNVTFTGVLSACSHRGLVELGYDIYLSMTRDHLIQPQIEHYGCMVDLLGRVGRLEDAYNFIREMKIAPDHITLGALLSACKIHGNTEIGEAVAKILVDCGYADSGTYILLSSVYALSGRWNEAAEVRAKMEEGGMLKEPGCSSIEVNNEIHEFLLGDIRHAKREEIYKKLEELNHALKFEGHLPATQTVMQDVEDGQKEWALAIHSERLAICYGLISTTPHTTLRIVKNLRVCNDCHSMIKLVSKITRRKIVVRDRYRFHHFESGACSCGDYW